MDSCLAVRGNHGWPPGCGAPCERGKVRVLTTALRTACPLADERRECNMHAQFDLSGKTRDGQMQGPLPPPLESMRLGATRPREAMRPPTPKVTSLRASAACCVRIYIV